MTNVTSMLRVSSYLLALSIIVSAGIVQGLWTNRWSNSKELERRARALDQVPLNVGKWQGHPLELDHRVMEQAGIKNYVMRRYEDRTTGKIVTALIVCGRPGPIAVHTPEICYAGSGYESLASRERIAIESFQGRRVADFWASDFRKENTVLPEYLRILYSFSGDGDWKASEYPRLEFGGAPALYKIYLIQRMNTPDERLAESTSVAFARELMPLLHKTLSPNS